MLESGFYNMDCMDGMAQFPDKFFDLCITDPPYGDGGGGNGTGSQEADSADGSTGTASESQSRIRRMVQPVSRTGGTWAEKYSKTGGRPNSNDIRHWDTAPTQEYFDELARIADKIIIWGGNYFNLPPSRNFIVWRKLTISETFSMAMAEYAWTNIEGNAKVFEAAPQGTKNEQRFHPTQKPIALYKWLLSNYAKPGDKILDTHVGSASSLIACHQMGFEYWGFELDTDYYKAATERLNKAKAQVSMAELVEKPTVDQIKII